MNSKQVIVMKKFASLRTGKYCAQAAHASMGALLSIGRLDSYGDNLIIPLHNPFVKEWLTGAFKKVTLYVETEEELLAVYDAAKKSNLPVSLIKDSGLTEFAGVPTITAVGIGPANASDIDAITGNLKLF
jgi:PTH2 family peptidyl-tRNA hydrolase